jgi:predicted transcriptional regulator
VIFLASLHVHLHTVGVHTVVCVLFALITAGSNACASVLQRKAAAQVPAERSMHVSLIADLVKRRVWVAGIGMVIVAAVAQAAALATGPIALVQPIFIIELPVTLVLAALANHNREKLRQLPWTAIATTTIALGVGLAIAQPSGASDEAQNTSWIIALIATAIFETVLIISAMGTSGEPRAALLGLAAACGYALTAALMKNAMADLDEGAVPFFTNWHIYATAVAGVGSLFLLQNALQAGSLVASQPMLTVGDALISISYGVTLYSESVRVGWWLLPEIIALAAIIGGCVQIAKSPLAAESSGLTAQAAPTALLSTSHWPQRPQVWPHEPRRRYSYRVNRLGELERAIMEVLWRTDSALTVRQVSNGLPQNLAHTTVMTVLDRLAKKGFARRERDGRAWRYRPAATREAYVAELMLTALAQTGDRDAALARFAQSVSGAEAEVLRDALSRLEQEHQENETEGDSGVGLWGHSPTRYSSPRSRWEACAARMRWCMSRGRAGPRRPRFCCGRLSAWPVASLPSARCSRSASVALERGRESSAG